MLRHKDEEEARFLQARTFENSESTGRPEPIATALSLPNLD